MNRTPDDDTDQEIATVDAAGQTVVSRLREAEKQLAIVLDALDADYTYAGSEDDEN